MQILLRQAFLAGQRLLLQMKFDPIERFEDASKAAARSSSLADRDASRGVRDSDRDLFHRATRRDTTEAVPVQ
jgi:hypothetical protein